MVNDLLWALTEPTLDADTCHGAARELWALRGDADQWRVVAQAARALGGPDRPGVPGTPEQGPAAALLGGSARAAGGGTLDGDGGDSGRGSGGGGGPELGPIGTSLLLTNELVNVWEVRLEPGQAQGWHRHDYPYVILGLEKGTSRITDTSGMIRTALPGDDPGFAVFDPGGATHMLENIGVGRIVDRLIEFKTALRDDLVRQVYIPGASG